MPLLERSSRRPCHPLGDDLRHVLLLVNRTAGSGKGREIVDEVATSLVAKGFPTEIVGNLEDLHGRVSELQSAGQLRVVLSAGGDGTFGAVLNATPPGTPLAVLPMGTENLLAKYLQHRCAPADVVRLIEEGVVVPLDAARAGGRLFSMMLSAGFDAEVVRRVAASRRGNITHLAYAKPLFQSLAAYRFPRIRVTWSAGDAKPTSAEVSWSFITNLPRYAMRLPLAPHADGTDGQIDLCLLERGSWISSLWYLGNVLCRRHHRLQGVTIAQATRIRLEALGDSKVPYQIDGDPGGYLPVDLEVVPSGMSVVVEEEVASRLGFARADS